MSQPGTPSKPTAASGSGSTRSHREDVLQFLDNLDSFDDVKAGSGSPGPASGSSKAASSSQSSKNDTSRAGAGAASGANANAVPGTTGEDAQSVLDFLDEIVTSREKRTPTPTASSISTKRSTAVGGASGVTRSSSRTSLNNSVRTSTESKRGSSYLTPSGVSSSPRSATAPASQAAQTAEKLQETPLPESAPAQAGGGGGWGWGSVWSQASNAIQQARTVAEEQVSKNLQNIPTSISSLQAQLPSTSSISASQATAQASSAANAASEQAAKWRSGMLNLLSTHVDIEKLRRDITQTGMKAMNDIINAVAPPIAEHEVIQVNLSHDMLGYEGVETLVYRALAKVMEQVEGGDLVVNRGNIEDQPVSKAGTDINEDERDLNTVEGFVEAYKLAEANLDALIKRNYKKPESKDAEKEEEKEESGAQARKSSESVTSPVTICPVYMRIQPVLAPLPFSLSPNSATTPSASAETSGTATPTPSTSQDDRHLFFILLLRDPTNELVHKTLSQSMPSKWLDIPFEDNEWVEDIMVDVIRRGVEVLGEEYVKGRMYGRSLKNAPAAQAENETLFDGEEGKEEEKDASARLAADAGVLV